ncbi:MAG: DUF4239 domain-containing protein [Chloroflexota bacterium]|nr:DUF4239 domain-containing protein [Chloroflexota bacterium]MDE3103067.1 DUF4239 domain-containing protein [Chloroflexota bacterium]
MNDVVLAVLAVVAAMVVAVAGFVVVDRLWPVERREPNNEVAGFIYAVVGPMYAILLAFVVFVVWGHFEDAKADVATEANQVAVIWDQARGLDPAHERALRQVAVAYARDVVNDDWALMSSARLSPQADKDVVEMFDVVLSLPVETARDQALYAQLLSDVHDLANERRVRLLRTQDSLHPVLWAVLLIGAAITVAYSYVFGMRQRLVHGVLVAALAGTVVGMLCMIRLIDGPFVGTVSVRPDAFETILRSMSGGSVP